MTNNITISIDDNEDRFPQILKTIPRPPEKLYCKGDTSLLNTTCIAIVGSRAATEYGKWTAYTLAKRIAQSGVTVVSGLAEGIDSEAHRGALEAGGKTIAVLGNGTDICYPRHNKNLYENIIKEGLVISEYEDGTKPERYTFPQRNRIISGLSMATVVAEAGIKSGSLITADLAEDQGRAVFAVPGNINRKTSFGCNKLIADGANILVTFDDVLSYLNVEIKLDEDEYNGLSQTERLIIEKVKNTGEITVDLLSQSIDMPSSTVSGIITVLEMKGHIHTAYGKIFIEN